MTTDSKVAVYEALIALAWADHTLDDAEKKLLHSRIEGNVHLTDEQKKELLAYVDSKKEMSVAWEKITDPEDRAFLLNAAEGLFHSDGEYCENEKAIFEEYFEKHLKTLDAKAIEEDLAELKATQLTDRDQLEAEMKEYRSQFSLIGRIDRLIKKYL